MAQEGSSAMDALYLSFCYSYGIGTIRDERLALQWCILAADRGSIPAKYIAKMLHDGYLSAVKFSKSHIDIEEFQITGKTSTRYLVEALKVIEQTSSDRMSEDMTRICSYVYRSSPSVYTEEVYPRLKWPVVDQLLRVFVAEHTFLNSDIIDYRLYTNTLAFAVNMQSRFPLADGSSILHCLAYIVCPRDTHLLMLAAIVVASGSSITAVRNDGNTAIELAVHFGNGPLVSVLLDTYVALGINSGIVRPLISRAVERHYYGICQMLQRYATEEEGSQMQTICTQAFLDAVKLSRLERIITRGQTFLTDGEQLLNCLRHCGGPQIFTMENPTFLKALKLAISGGNDDIFSCTGWSIIRTIPPPMLVEILEQTTRLGERELLRTLLPQLQLDRFSVQRLLKCALQSPLSSRMQMVETILDCCPIPVEDYIVDLVNAGTLASDLVARIVRHDPHVLTLRFGSDGQTLLQHAVASGELEIAQHLFNHGAAVNVPSKNGNTPLHTAIEAFREASISWLLGLQNSINIEFRNKLAQTPLLYATQLANLPAIRLLLEHHANIKAITDEGYTVLHLAYSRYCSRTFQKLSVTMPYLVARKEEMEAQEMLGAMLKVLREYGADEEAAEFVMGYNPKSYFAWLLESANEAEIVRT